MTIRDAKLTPEILENLGFERQIAEPGKPATFLLRRHGRGIAVTADAAAWGAGWDLEGMKPADIGDLLVMLVFAGEKIGRREFLYQILENAEIGSVLRWASAVKRIEFVDPDAVPAAKPVAKSAAKRKPPAKRKKLAAKPKKK